MAISYHSGPRGYIGSLVYLTSTSGQVNGGVIPAYTLVDQTGAAVPAGSSSDPISTQAPVLPASTDRSGTATTSSAALAAANATRRGLMIQNIGANNIGVNEQGGTAAIGTAGTYTLAPGASFRVSTNKAVNVIAATASTAFTATEW